MKQRGLVAIGVAVLLGCVWTAAALEPLPERLPGTHAPVQRSQVVDRRGVPLSYTYENRWNTTEIASLHEMPPLLRAAFLRAEDRRFFDHAGVDWYARAAALVQNLRAGRVVRGASTISEQCVRMLHPRPRTPWSRFLEGLEARALEERFGKSEILAFYLNQVPYARRRRGVVQAARLYFDRDLETLSAKEMLALAVLVRRPGGLDLARGTVAVEAPIARLARSLETDGVLTPDEVAELRAERLVLHAPPEPVAARHFVAQVRRGAPAGERPRARLRSTLDARLQAHASRLLEERVLALAAHGVGDGALLVVDHRDDAVRAWVNARGPRAAEHGEIDAVRTPRQPGSTLKPFVYALAIEKGWTAATIVDDAPLALPVGHGLHGIRNYSRTHYGPVRVRQALGSSLNVPAIRAVQVTGVAPLLDRLRRAGFESLSEPAHHYGEGLALGNGEVSLFELVRGYAALARGGELRGLRLREDDPPAPGLRIFGPAVSALVADILVDPTARELEFGRGGVLELPVPTAVKTGTSSDHRDAWAVGFSERYSVGVWMGNLDNRPMQMITGARGPALVLRAVFAELRRGRETGSSPSRPGLLRRPICAETAARPGAFCPIVREWFRAGRAPQDPCPGHAGGAEPAAAAAPRLASPSPGLHLAMDPRIPDHVERFALRLAEAPPGPVAWLVDDVVVATTPAGRSEHLWPLEPGPHRVRARLLRPDGSGAIETAPVRFEVRGETAD